MTRFQLMSALFGNGILTIGKYTGTLQSVQREDGSGRCFNVTMYVNGNLITVFVRTID